MKRTPIKSWFLTHVLGVRGGGGFLSSAQYSYKFAIYYIYIRFIIVLKEKIILVLLCIVSIPYVLSDVNTSITTFLAMDISSKLIRF